MKVLITGGTKGIGAGIVQAFEEAGHEVLPVARNDAPLCWDVRKAPEDLIVAAVKHLGGLDVLINNAGGSPPVASATVSDRFTAAIIDLNLTAPMLLAKHAKAAGAGCVRPRGPPRTARPRRASSTPPAAWRRSGLPRCA